MTNSGQFQAGKSGNPHGRKVEKIWRDALLKAVLRRIEGQPDAPRKLDQLADALVDKGMTGDVAAVKEIADRIDGKAIQPITGDGDDGALVVKIVRLAAEEAE